MAAIFCFCFTYGSGHPQTKNNHLRDEWRFLTFRSPSAAMCSTDRHPAIRLLSISLPGFPSQPEQQSGKDQVRAFAMGASPGRSIGRRRKFEACTQAIH